MKYEKELVSVVMPAYNAEKTIKKAIESVMDQSYIDWELIIVDDGSTDNTKEEVFAVRDNRIHYYYQENAGPSVARNYAIEKSKGEFICFLDSDDLLHADYLNVLVSSAISSDVDIAMCDYVKVKENEMVDLHIDIPKTSPKVQLSTDDCIIQMFYKRKVMPYPYLKMIRREVIGTVRFPEKLRLGEDLAFNYALFRKISKAIFIDMPLYYHVENSCSITHSVDQEVAMEHFSYLREILDNSETKYRSAVLSRMFIVAYDFICQMNENNLFFMELKKFINDNKLIVLKNTSSGITVRILALLSLISVTNTVRICKIAKKFHFRKAI